MKGSRRKRERTEDKIPGVRAKEPVLMQNLLNSLPNPLHKANIKVDLRGVNLRVHLYTLPLVHLRTYIKVNHSYHLDLLVVCVEELIKDLASQE